MLTSDMENKIEDFIIKYDLVSRQELTKLRDEAKRQNKPLVQYLIEKNAISEEDSTKINALITHIPYVDLKDKSVPTEVLNIIPKDIATTYMAVPFGLVDGQLNVAMVDPTNLQAVDFITRKTGHVVNAYMTTKENVMRIIDTYQATLDVHVVQQLGEQAASSTKAEEKLEGSTKKATSGQAIEVQNFVQDAPITRALNTIFEYAISSKASDIHIEPRQKELKIRFRIDGLLQDTMTLPKTIEPALISRIKILSNLKIDEHRIPQDGQAEYIVNRREVDLRIAIAPITYGEQVVIRILDKSDSLINLDALGFKGRSYRLIQEGMKKPHGMILSTDRLDRVRVPHFMLSYRKSRM